MIKLLPANMQTKITVADAPWACWLWTGAVTSTGYGSVSHHGRIWSSHRLAYESIIGPIADGMTIDHLCRNKLCCNPSHLEPVTNAENIRRGRAARRRPQPRVDNTELKRIFEHYFGTEATA